MKAARSRTVKSYVDPQTGGACFVMLISYLNRSPPALRRGSLLGRQGLYQLSYSRKTVSISAVGVSHFVKKSGQAGTSLSHPVAFPFPYSPLSPSIPPQRIEQPAGLLNSLSGYPDIHIGLAPAFPRVTMVAPALPRVKGF